MAMTDAVDFDYLETYAAGDRQVIAEVLGLFLGQARGWSAELAAPDAARWRDLAHTIKGSARGIGAGPLAEAADRGERGAPDLAADLRAALHATVADIERYLARAAET
jgi:HPt (histidine-containing phosphotransfer) domain-containing protein